MTYLAQVNLPSLSIKQFWLGAILLHILGFLQAWHSGSIYLVDSIDYLSQATNIRLHSSLYAAPWEGPLKPDYFTFRPPVYGSLLFLIKLFVQSDYAILVLQMGISLLTLWGVLHFAEKEGYAAGKSRFLLLLVLLLYPSQIIHCNFVMSDILFQALLFWSFYFTVQLWQNPSYPNGSKASVLFAIAMLTKPVAFLLGMGIAIILIFVLFKQNKIKYLLPFLLLPLVYSAYSGYNKSLTGYAHYSSVTPVFVLKYMAKYTNSQIYGEAYADSVQEHVMQVANAAPTYGERYEWMNAKGKEIILTHPVFFAWFNIKGWVAMMIDPGRFEWVHFLNMDEGNYLGLYHVIHTQGLVNGIWSFIRNAPLVLLGTLFVCLIWNLFCTYTFLVFLFSKYQKPLIRICVFLFVAYLLATTGVLGLSRYRIAIAPLLWIAVLAFFDQKKKQANGTIH